MTDDKPIVVTRTEPVVMDAESHRLPPEIQEHYDGWLAACERIWRATKDPFILASAIRHTAFYGQPDPPWLAAAAGEAIIKGRTPAHERRYRERIVHVQRWSRVRALRAQGMTWDVIKEADRTAYNSYALVEADTQDGRNSKYWVLSDTTRRPHLG